VIFALLVVAMSSQITIQGDTLDRLTVVKKDIADAKEAIKSLKKHQETLKGTNSDKDELIRAQDNLIAKLDDIEKLQDDKEKLEHELGSGKYFAKTSDIFPKENVEERNIADIQGKAYTFQRKAPLGLYEQQRLLFVKHLNPGDNSKPDFNSLASSTSSAGGAPASGRSTPTSGPPKHRIAAIPSSGGKATQMADPKACIIERKDGHKGHLGSDSANCSAWWALVYGWMIGNIDELVAKQINEEHDPDEKKKKKDRIYKALVILANGVSGREKGMRSDDRNILYVPNPHDQYYDKGCNWVIFPIMTPDEMVNWAGQTYDVAIFAGETIPEVQEKGNIWKDGPSKFSAEQAEKALFNELHLGEEIDICTTEDLEKVAKGLGEMGLALSDLHTRGSSSDFKVRILDLASAVNQYIVKEKPQKKQLDRNEDHDNIVDGITELIDELKTRSFSVPLPPTENHFGPEKKNVFKARVRQSNAPDPIALAAKGANNFYRQWGIRLLTGCHSNPTDDDSSSIIGGSVQSAAAQPTTPFKDFTGFEFVVVTPPDRDGFDNDSCSDLSG